MAGAAADPGVASEGTGLVPAITVDDITVLPRIPDPDPLTARDRAVWRRWLQRHHPSRDGAFVEFHKKSSASRSITYEEAVEEALCFGWIDSKPNTIDAERYKLLAFVLSAALSGLAGATKAIVFQLASLTDVHWTMSGEVVLMTLLGGMGTIFGPVVGAFAIIGLESYLAGFGQWVTVITGGIFVVCVLAFRRGIVGEIGAWWASRKE